MGAEKIEGYASFIGIVMTMVDREKVKEVTISKLKEYIHNGENLSEDTILTNLKIDDDDLSEAIIRIQEITQSKPPIKSWRQVNSIGDVISLIIRYLPENRVLS